jgi:hypothetical protein
MGVGELPVTTNAVHQIIDGHRLLLLNAEREGVFGQTAAAVHKRTHHLLAAHRRLPGKNQ